MVNANLIDNNIVDKVKKLLALAGNNSSEHESQSAMLKAQELLVRHGLTLEDVSETEDKQTKEVTTEAITDRKRTLWWYKSLAVIISENFRCKAFTTTFGGKSCIKFLGLKEDVALAKEIFNFAIDSIVYNADVFCDKYRGAGYNVTPIKNDYIRGYLKGLQDKFKEQIDKNGWGLVLVKDALVDKAVEQLSLKKGKTSSFRSGGSTEAYQSGYEHGKNFSHSAKKPMLK